VANEPFHEGEIAIQIRTGERELACRHGAGISSRIETGALPFLRKQRLLALVTAGDDALLWASVWCGETPFVDSNDGQRVSIAPAAIAVPADDPVLSRIAVGREVGVLAIEPISRRRLRINGTIERASAGEIGVLVRESVANCPKYIQRRQPSSNGPAPDRRRHREDGRVVDGPRRALIEAADTCFVGSVHPVRGVDVSHRGGTPGFIRVVDESTLRIPDYRGNSMFMTLGNFEVDPRASLAIVDFDDGRLLSLSGSARLYLEAEDAGVATGGTGRHWDFSVREWLQFDLPSAANWELIDRSPFNPPEVVRS
jgi:predicted pyridoxine 5'-phosphate oxidase superfamily flavin-nucleotide-binding protein